MELGKVISITGNGKGKTTAAVGIGLGFALQGKPVRMVQFLKGGSYTGELLASQHFGELFRIEQFGKSPENADRIAKGIEKVKVQFRENREKGDHFAATALEKAKEYALDPKVKVLILDEISSSIRREFVELAQVIQLISNKRSDLTLVLTGRQMSPEIVAMSSECIEATMKKHPIEKGIRARWGIQY